MRHLTGKELTPRMKQVAQYIFEHPTDTQRQVGQSLGIHHSRVSQIMRSNRFLAAFPVLARARIKGMVPEAVGRYRQLMKQNLNPEVARKVASEVLHNEKVLDAPETVITNRFELMTVKDLAEYVSTKPKISESYIDADIVSDDQPS